MLHRIFYIFLLPLEISHDKTLHNFCFLPNIVKIINKRTIIQVWLVAQVGETKMGTFFWKPEIYRSVWKTCWRQNVKYHCTTRRKVARLILDSVTGICHWLKPSVRTMALVLTQSIREMSTRNISWGIKVRRANNFTTFMCQFSWNLGNLTFWKNFGLVQACKRTALLKWNDFYVE
jgi:hypothetical protein